MEILPIFNCKMCFGTALKLIENSLQTQFFSSSSHIALSLSYLWLELALKWLGHLCWPIIWVFLVVAVGCVIGRGGSGDNYDGEGGASWTRHPWTEDKFLHSPQTSKNFPNHHLPPTLWTRHPPRLKMSSFPAPQTSKTCPNHPLSPTKWTIHPSTKDKPLLGPPNLQKMLQSPSTTYSVQQTPQD